MKILFCPLHYLDDDLLLEVHTTFHKIENAYLKSNKDSTLKNSYIYKCINFFYSLKERSNWFYQLHERCVTEINYRFNHYSKEQHKTPPILNINVTYRTWFPSNEKYINNDIQFLIHRYRFKRKNIVYTKRQLPDFLVNVERNIDATCDNCIYFLDDIKKKKCISPNLRKKGGFCASWTDGNIKYLFDN